MTAPYDEASLKIQVLQLIELGMAHHFPAGAPRGELEVRASRFAESIAATWRCRVAGSEPRVYTRSVCVPVSWVDHFRQRFARAWWMRLAAWALRLEPPRVTTHVLELTEQAIFPDIDPAFARDQRMLRLAFRDERDLPPRS